MEKKQCVVRTWPNGYNSALTDLFTKLNEGWKVVIVTPIVDKQGCQCNDYILEKEVTTTSKPLTQQRE